MAVNNPYIWGTGRRKTSTARVRIKPGTGKFLVNGREFDGTSGNEGWDGFDQANNAFLAHVARKGLPVILSTGMATVEEIGRAVETVRGEGNRNIVLLQCVSAYPSTPADTNLRAMQTLADLFQTPVGYSDHTDGIEIALAAAALGACVIEKHFTTRTKRACCHGCGHPQGLIRVGRW